MAISSLMCAYLRCGYSSRRAQETGRKREFSYPGPVCGYLHVPRESGSVDIFYSPAARIPFSTSTRESIAAPMMKNAISEKILRRLDPVVCETTAKTSGPTMPANFELMP